MALKDTIADLVKNLRKGSLSNEQAVCTQVHRVLQDMGWDVWDPKRVWREYTTQDGGRADFALCEPHSKPKVLIEVKQPGKAEDGIKQLLNYAFHTGAPLGVLTDGQTWRFYLPAEPGPYEDRLVNTLDLYEHQAEWSASVLQRYLCWQDIASGNALKNARQDHQSKARRDLARQAIPEAWKQLVDQCDKSLIDLVGDAVESKKDVRPADEDVTKFLAALEMSSSDTLTRATTPIVPKSHKVATPPDQRPKPTPHQKGIVVLFGKEHLYKNAKERLVIVMRELAKRDRTFLGRCYQVQKFRGAKRRYIARNIDELYPSNDRLQKTGTETLPDGWLLGTNLNNSKKDDLVQAAIEVAGITPGTDIKG